MLLRNYTPFVPLVFEARDVRDRPFGVVVLRGTFDLDHGARLRPAETQEALVETDVYHGNPAASSILIESDLAPFKPRTDICLNATACAPRGRPRPEWDVSVRVGSLEKRLRILGRRTWRRVTASRWDLSSPEPTAAVPVRYELAFGSPPRPSGAEVFDRNPVGRGFRAETQLTDTEVEAPQIESPDDPAEVFGHSYPPQGLGPIARAWSPRRQLAGTFDRHWQAERWPALPEDFDFAFYNCAHPDLIYPGFLRGDEDVLLHNLDPTGDIGFQLPAWHIVVLLRHQSGALEPVAMSLDTLFIDVPARRAYLTWRVPYVSERPPRVLEIRPVRGGHG